MKYKYWIIAILFFILLGVGIFFFFSNQQNNNKNNNYDVSRTEATANTNKNKTNSIEKSDKNNESSKEQNDSKQEETPLVETEISSFTTKIYSTDSGRQNNVQITCSTLNDTIVENGATFSFCNTVGQATTAKGYQKAEIFDNKRK